jgi:DNA (cytosine-5)-methyltransferase 1
VTADELVAARKALGLSQSGLAEALRLGPNGDRTVRRWEAGDVPVTGPASLAIELLLASKGDVKC